MNFRTRTRVVFPALVGLLAMGSARTDVTTWTKLGLEGSPVQALAIDPTDPMTLYAGTLARGVFKGDDRGTSWTAINSGLTDREVRALVIDPTDPMTLYAGTRGGVFKSDNGGTSWAPINSGLTNLFVFALAIDPTDPITLYAGTGGGLFVSELEQKLYFAQFRNGGGFTSDTVLTNPLSTDVVSATVNFLDDKGDPLPIGIAARGNDATPLSTIVSPLQITTSLDFSIPPLGAVTLSTDGQGDLVAGAAVVTSDNTLGGVIRFSIPGIGIAGVGASQSLGAFIVSVRKGGGINTGIAIHNAESQAVTFQLSLRQDGQEVPNGRTTLEDFPGSGHLAKFIDELFPDANTGAFEGTLVVEVTGGRVAATALELGTQPGQFTTLPATPLN